MLGSFPGTVAFFGSYEYCKRNLLDFGVSPSLAYLASGKKTLFPLKVTGSNHAQVSLPILLPPSYMCLPK